MVAFVIGQEDTKGEVKTRYDISGRPVNQALYAKGYHQVVGNARLVSGLDTLELNTSTTNGRQDISYSSDSTYHGIVWSSHAGDTGLYMVEPISGTSFIIKVAKKSVWSDTAYVRFTLQGE